MEKKHIVYAITLQGEVKYIGCTSNFDFRKYAHLNCKDSTIHSAIPDGTDLSLINFTVMGEYNTKKQALEVEDNLIIEYDTINNGWNKQRSGLISQTKEYKKEKDAEYYQSHKKEQNERRKRWVSEHKEQYDEYLKNYNTEHIEEIREYKRDYAKKWRKDNPDKMKENNKKWHSEHWGEYYAAHKDEINAKRREKRLKTK